MDEKNTQTVIIVAVIGAIGAIVAACIGLIPTVLPMVRPTITPSIVPTATVTPSYTVVADTPSEIPTLTATLQPLEIPTETQTTVPTPASSSSNIDDYEGTWLNVDQEPSSDRVQLVITRIEIERTSDTTANVSVCRHRKEGDIYVVPHPAQATLYDFAVVARDFTIPVRADLKWTIFVQQSGNQLVATVQEYDLNNILLNSDTFRLQRPNLLESIGLSACEDTPATATP